MVELFLFNNTKTIFDTLFGNLWSFLFLFRKCFTIRMIEMYDCPSIDPTLFCVYKYVFRRTLGFYVTQ